MKKQMGFSLIELMVVVVIIGVLSTLGGSQYQKFQMNAKRSEAKALLSGMYTAQKAFFGEWNQYYGDFNAVGYGLEGNIGWFVGFKGVTGVGPETHPSFFYRNQIAYIFFTDQFCTQPGRECTWSESGADWGDLVTGAQASNTSFQFSAAANLDSDIIKEQWTLSDNRKLELVTDDIAL